MFSLRHSALLAGCMACLVPVASQATAITMDFESLVANTAVGNAYNALGVNFTGDLKVVDGSAFSPSPVQPGFKFGLSETGFTLDVLDPTATQFDILSLAYFGPLIIRVRDNLGSAPVDVLIDGYTGYDQWRTLTDYKLDRTQYGLIDSIDFVFNSLTTSDGFAIDNLALSLQPVTTPPPPPTAVPEPTSYALAGLALLGVGLASRRRQRG